MQSQLTQDTLHALNEVKSMGYIKPAGNNILENYQKIDHALSDFFKVTPINPKEALECMEQLTHISQNTPIFFPCFSKKMMDLYDWANSGDILTQRYAETKLLLFFSYISPDSVEQKNRLLDQIQQMPDLLQRRLMVAKVVKQITNHYDTTKQFDRDPNLSVLKSLCTILNTMCDAPKKFRSTNITSEEKSYFNMCATLIKKHEPSLYKDPWQEKFAPSTAKKISIPYIGEAVEICSRQNFLKKRPNFFLGWERD